MRAFQRYASVSILVFCVSIAVAQKPKISNARVQEVSSAAGLKVTVDGLLQKETSPFWIGYRIPAAAKERTMCCFDSVDQLRSSAKCCAGCKMESEDSRSFNGTVSDCSPPEPLPYAFIFFRAGGKQCYAQK